MKKYLFFILTLCSVSSFAASNNCDTSYGGSSSEGGCSGDGLSVTLCNGGGIKRMANLNGVNQCVQSICNDGDLQNLPAFGINATNCHGAANSNHNPHNSIRPGGPAQMRPNMRPVNTGRNSVSPRGGAARQLPTGR
jgi:hypothetical protein